MGILAMIFAPFELFSRRKNIGDNEPLHTAPPAFDLSEAVESLPPDVYLRRDTATKPSLLLTRAQFVALQEQLPHRFQGRRWRLVFGSEYHGFSRLAFQHNCAEEVKSACGRERHAVLIIKAGNDGQLLLGAYISVIPQASNRKYIGSEESFLFAVPPAVTSGAAEASATAETREPAATSAPESFIRFFKPPSNAPNRYFMRCEDGNISLGGGGKGPAVVLHSDFVTVSCSTACPTFGLHESLLLLNMRDGDELPSGVKMEGGEPFASVRAIQLWVVGDECFTAL
ncbi:hypothetical protein DQ04_10811010 [Trypanosoma grayi]|uniref:hypothetical protein n=1 Tax=Trypanosoma grayi TaxID=71804 RepID=UPI0004F45FFF|nr:hypothetical protein DQ04_10811010 [Trypanosoma grayi]KEG07127.1 hypothetical protein DQ04_10811010 [Trypanosoma grayi]